LRAERAAIYALTMAACSSTRPNAVDARSTAGRCHVLQDCFEVADADRDGCPDAALSFAANSSELLPDAQKTLHALAEEASRVRLRKLGLIGSASEQEPSELAVRRANVARDWLRGKLDPSVELTVESASRGARLWFMPTCEPPRTPG
jgi:outer membrane protein OmpA-like peptidoglycan-associated protein